MSVRVCIACCVWSEIRSRPEIASRRRFDLAGRSHLIRSISGSVRVYPNPVRSGSLLVLVGTRGREGGCHVWAADPSGPDPMPPNPAHVHRSPPVHTAMVLVRKHPRAGKAYNLPTGRRGHASKGAHEGPSRPVLTQPVLRGPTPCTTRGWLTPGKAPSINMWASQPHTCSMSVEGCPGRGPCEPSRTARRPPMRSRRRSVPRRAVCLLP